MKYLLEIITVVVLVLFVGSFVAIQGGDHEFGGADGIAAEAIAEMTGLSEEDVKPLFPQWEPPSGEIESGLFALQAAIGGIIVGLVFGYWLGCRKITTQRI